MLGHNPIGGPTTGANTFGDGGVTNYAAIAADGEITLFGTARVIKHIEFDNADFGKGATVPAQVILGSFNGWEYDISDDSHLNFILPHDYAAGTDIEVHVRWYCGEDRVTNSGEVQWRCAWAALPSDSSETIDSPTHSGTNDTADIDIPTSANVLTESVLVIIPGTDLMHDDSIGLDIERVALTAGSNPTQKPTIINVHIEYLSDKLGDAT